MSKLKSYKSIGRALLAGSFMAVSLGVNAAIEGTAGSTFDLYAKKAQISTPDGDSFQIWAFAEGDVNGPQKAAQYPGPTMIVNQGATVVITLHNVDIPQNVSLVFPGQAIAAPTVAEEVSIGGTSVTYSFNANKPGTYMYHSGVNPQIQVDMGLVGTLIVKPATAGQAYDHPATAYDDEFLFFLSEMDPKLHYLAENDALDQWDNSDYNSVLFFINGRNAPDTLANNFYPDLPHQPYSSLVTMFPGDQILVRTLNAGRNQHPLHLHGNHFDQIARDGNLKTNTVGDLIPVTDYTLGAAPGSTADMLFNWTGKGMGWDIYNSQVAHTCTDNAINTTGAAGNDGFDDTTWEWCADHGKPLPVVIPENQDLGFGGFYGGSPYLGDFGTLPVGEGGLNPSGGMVFMWHSHSERELTNNDIYPGGMLTMAIVNKR